MSSRVKVSIVVPVYNVEQYLRECLDSLINQTLEDIEIICVNDGSTDGSLSILREYESNDSRVKVIDKPNAGYGQTMNVGFDAANGEYIGIVESDDFVSEDMYETLYIIANKENLDLIKADFYSFEYKNNEKIYEYTRFSKYASNYNTVFCPRNDVMKFKFTLKIWSGIYRTDFIRKYRIRFNETPGASYQDNGFFFQTFAWADRAYFLDKPLYRYRCDNPNASVKSREKVYCIHEEYQFIRDFLTTYPELEEKLLGIYYAKLYIAYCVTYDRIGDEFKKEFILFFSNVFNTAFEKGELNKQLFFDYEIKQLELIMRNPIQFHTQKLRRKEINELNNNKIRMATQRFAWCCQDHGLKYTLKRGLKKVFKNNQANIHKLYICSTYHHVFITVIKMLLVKQIADVVICDDIPNYKNMQCQLIKSGLFRHVYFFKRSNSPDCNAIIFKHSCHKKLVEREFKIDLKRYSDIYIYHDGTKLGRYLQDKKQKYHLIEDGINTYQILREIPSRLFPLPPKNKIKYFLKFFFNIGYLPCGQNRFCLSIEVNDKSNLAITHRNLVEVPKESLYGRLTNKQKLILYKIFVSGIFLQGSYDVILLTIPLFKDKYVKSEYMQIKIYKDIIEDLELRGESVVIKPHPRDNVDYSRYFTNNIIIDKNIPTEVLNYNPELHFKKGITILSSSLDSIDFVDQKEWYGIEYLDKKYKQFITDEYKGIWNLN